MRAFKGKRELKIAYVLFVGVITSIASLHSKYLAIRNLDVNGSYKDGIAFENKNENSKQYDVSVSSKAFNVLRKILERTLGKDILEEERVVFKTYLLGLLGSQSSRTLAQVLDSIEKLPTPSLLGVTAEVVAYLIISKILFKKQFEKEIFALVSENSRDKAQELQQEITKNVLRKFGAKKSRIVSNNTMDEEQSLLSQSLDDDGTRSDDTLLHRVPVIFFTTAL